MDNLEFFKFPSISRLSRDCIVTEKIDGTNSQIVINEDGTVNAGSRNRYLSLDKDNFGFASWVEQNKTELLKLGPGRHFGEWWGLGIQRGYGLFERRFSLFHAQGIKELPKCVSIVPVLYEGPFDTHNIARVLEMLKMEGSCAVPGFMNPEGIVIFHTASRTLFKKTIENDEKGKNESVK